MLICSVLVVNGRNAGTDQTTTVDESTQLEETLRHFISNPYFWIQLTEFNYWGKIKHRKGNHFLTFDWTI